MHIGHLRVPQYVLLVRTYQGTPQLNAERARLRGVDEGVPQEGAYFSLLRSRRREMHRQTAEWFAEQDLTLQAHHLDRAAAARAANHYTKLAIAERPAFS